MVSKLIRNVISHWAGYGVQIAVAFFLTPFVIHSLGETRYGVWILSVGLSGYYGLLDLGFSAGMTQYITRYLATKDFKSMNGTASTGVVVLTCCGVVVFFGSLMLALNATYLFHVPHDLRPEVTMVIIISGASVAMQFFFFTYSAVFTAVQRFDLSNGIGIATRLLSALGTVAVLKLGYGLVGISLVLLATNLLDYLIRWRVALWLLPSLRISLNLFRRESLIEIMKFGVWNFTIVGSVRLISYTDSLIIAAFMPVAAVAPFAIAASLRSYFDEIFVRVGYVLFPTTTELDARGDQTGLKNLYLAGSKFMFLGSILCGSIGMVCAGDFFRLWLGSEFVYPENYHSVVTIFCVLIVGSIIGVAQRIGHQVFLGTRRISMLAGLIGAEAIFNLILSVFLIRTYGLLGVALGTVLPAVILEGIVQPIFICRFLKISFGEYVREVLIKPGLFVTALGLLYVAFPLTRPSADWIMLLLKVAAWSVLVVPIGFMIGFSKGEKSLMWPYLNPLRLFRFLRNLANVTIR